MRRRVDFGGDDFGVLVGEFEGRGVQREEVDGRMDEDGDTAATLPMAILDDEVVAWEARSPAIVVLKFRFLEDADFDGVGVEEVAKLCSRVLDAIAIPLGNYKTRGRRRAGMRVDGGDEEEEEDEEAGERKGRVPATQPERARAGRLTHPYEKGDDDDDGVEQRRRRVGTSRMRIDGWRYGRFVPASAS